MVRVRKDGVLSGEGAKFDLDVDGDEERRGVEEDGSIMMEEEGMGCGEWGLL